MARDDLVAALREELASASGSTTAHARLLEPAVLDLLGQLANCAGLDDIEAWQLVGTFQLLRYNLLPAGEDGAALKAALVAFSRVLPSAPDAVPKELKQLLEAAQGYD